ncbi:MAG TPA: DUF3037 domain-containing protein [Thermoanaerobaculia bacterium]|nr:DUF3037 domain-containing protein [Thermoanaerobaculia bacterium]
MPAPSSFDYAIVRVVPRVERGELLNAGVILFCLGQDFLGARVAVDEARLLALWPEIDLPLVRQHLEAIPRICAGGKDAGPIGRLSRRERFHWLVAPRSTMVQVSPVHSGLCEEPERALADLFCRLVELPAEGRQ